MSFDVEFENRVATLPERVYFQYRSKPKAVQWYDIIPSMGRELYDAYNDIRASYDIDSQSGEQLDIIGRIVNVTRAVFGEIPMPVAEFGDSLMEAGDSLNAQFGPLTVEGDINLSDDYMRKLIRWGIANNTGDATIEDIITAVLYAIPGSNPEVVDAEDMTFSIVFNGPIDDIDKLILDSLDAVPRPQGVQFTGYTEV